MQGFLRTLKRAMAKVIILIDGSNFYFKLKDLKLHKQLNFDFRAFNQFLAGKDQIIDACYYVGKIRQDGTPRTEKMFADQQKLIALLKRSGMRYSLGYLMKNDGKYHEKGVDVQMATDILVASYENRCQKIILVSSDTDLSPAIKKARQKGKQIEYIGFSHQPSVAMVSFCSSTRLLTEEEIRGFMLITGIALEESLNTVPNNIKVNKKEKWDVKNTTKNQPSSWTALHYYGKESQAEEIAQKFSNQLKSGQWYTNFTTSKGEVFVIFPGKIFTYAKGDPKGRKKAIAYGKSINIPKGQLDWKE